MTATERRRARRRRPADPVDEARLDALCGWLDTVDHGSLNRPASEDPDLTPTGVAVRMGA